MTAETFKADILRTVLEDLHKIEKDNYAAERFSFDGVDRSMLFDSAKHAACVDWFVSQYVDVFDAYRRLADEESRRLYIDVLADRLSILRARLTAEPELVAREFAESGL